MVPIQSDTPTYWPDPNGTAVRCTAHWCGINRLAAAACGPEQTGITLAFTNRVAAYKGLNIVGMTTSRVGGVATAFAYQASVPGPTKRQHTPLNDPSDNPWAAGSYMLVTDLSGSTKHLQDFHHDLLTNPWIEPRGKQVVAALTGDLDIVAPDRPMLLRDITRLVSDDYGINIETLVNETRANMYAAYDKLDLSRNKDDPEEQWAACEGVVSVTRMKLELPWGIDQNRFLASLSTLGKGWLVKWTATPAAPAISLSKTLGFPESRN